jgi:peptide/nickel transport system substrate-binding protein
MRKMRVLVALVLFSFSLLSACSPGTPQVASPTLPPTEEAPLPVAAFEPLAVSASCDSGSTINEIAALDELTVRFSLCQSDPAFLSKAAFIAFAIQPREHLEAKALDASILENPVGTGPWRFDSWIRGDSIIFERFDGYWGSASHADTLVFRWTREPAARWLELQSGNVDGIDFPSPDDYERILANAEYQLLFKAPLNNFYLGMNNQHPPFDDLRVRRAIAMGIDRQRLLDTFYPLGSKVATHFTPCEIANGCAGDPWYEFDPQAARALLEEAGYPEGFTTSIFYRDVIRSYLPEVGHIAQELQNQLAENLGITVNIELLESGEFVARAGDGDLNGLHMYGWIADFPHITNFLDTHFGESSVRFGSIPPEIYQPIKEASQIADAAEAEPLYADANNAIREFVPMVPMIHAVSAAAYKNDVIGAAASPLSTDNFSVMDPAGRSTLVWMQNAEPISLYCADETDSESLRACAQVLESLYSYVPGGTDFEPALATACEENEDSTVWTCQLREGVKFHDGSTLDANDVVTSWVAGWDASSPLHVGSTGIFEYYSTLFGLVNEPLGE